MRIVSLIVLALLLAAAGNPRLDFTGIEPSALGVDASTTEIALVMEVEFRNANGILKGFKPCDPGAP